MARDITQLHPRLQEIIPVLKEKCEAAGIKIAIGECLRTVAEQDALYAQGRTAGGSIVTNAKGSTYSSMHQWGVAFDFYLAMDIDGDGKTSDDAFNNSEKTFEAVGKIGKALGLEWGGDWKSIKDRPHFQLPDWGSAASKLKSLYGTPEKFFATWGVVTAEKAKTEVYKMKTLKHGSTGNDVTIFESIMKKMGLYNGKIDTHFGNGCVEACNKFQKKYPECGTNGKPDGSFGPKCWRKALSLLDA